MTLQFDGSKNLNLACVSAHGPEKGMKHETAF